MYCVLHSTSWRCERLKGAACTEPHPHPSLVVVEGLILDKPTSLIFCWFQFAIHKKRQFENRATEGYYTLQYSKICWMCFESEKKLFAHFRPMESGCLAFFSFYRAFSHFMYLRKFKFRKEEEHHYKMYKTFFFICVTWL